MSLCIHFQKVHPAQPELFKDAVQGACWHIVRRAPGRFCPAERRQGHVKERRRRRLQRAAHTGRQCAVQLQRDGSGLK